MTKYAILGMLFPFQAKNLSYVEFEALQRVLNCRGEHYGI